MDVAVGDFNGDSDLDLVVTNRRSAVLALVRGIGFTLRHPIRTLGLAVLCAGCMTVGRDFPVAPVDSVEIGTTTMADVRRLFGEPWRRGVEDGERTWTFAKYHYNVFGATQTRDLKVRFDAKDRVVAFSFNSTFPEDAKR